MSENIELLENQCVVDKEQLKAVIDLNDELKYDIIQLVNVFKGFAAVLNGKTSVMQIIPVITRLMKDTKQLEAFAHIIPIIEKYTVTEATDNEQREITE